MFLLGTFQPIFAQDTISKKTTLTTEKQDSIQENTPRNLTQKKINKNDSKKKQKLEHIVERKAKDYEKLDQKNKKVTLYNEAEFKYQEYELKAGIIVYDYDKKELYAGRIRDSLGNFTQNPVFKQGNQVSTPDSIRFNMDSKKAIVWNTRSTYQDFNIKAERMKKVNDSVLYMQNVKFTTAKDIDNPEYYFNTHKVKFVPNKKVVAGVTNMVIADVPTPIALPFAFFPMTNKASSGFIMPSFGDTNQRGYFLQNGGFYFALSDRYDLTLLGDYYTNGTYRLEAQSNYAKRYKFNGNFAIRYEYSGDSEMGFPDYYRSKIYNIQWSHTQDAKANPNSRISASVNLGSSNFFRQSMSSQNIGSQLNNTLQSSVSYSKTIQTVPQINLSLSATHSQNVNTKQISLTLPTLQASMDRIYPFAPKSGSKKGFFHNINFQYNVNSKNSIQTTDSLFFTKQMFQNMNTGMQHSIPINTNFKLLKYISVSVSGNYNEVWYLNTIRKYYNETQNSIVNERINKFDAFRTYNFSTNLGTTIYGTFNLGNKGKIQALRHVMRPSITYTYTPSFQQYYDSYAIDATGTTMEEYTRFENGIYGSPSKQMSNMLSFSLGNNLEAKIRDDQSPNGESKKVTLLNSLNLSTSYNMTADSLKLAPVRISANTNLLKNKLQLNLGTTLDPYAINNSGNRIDMLNIANGGSLFRMTSANMTLNYSLSSTDAIFGNLDRDRNSSDEQNVRNGGRADDLFGKSTDLSDRRKSMFGEDNENTPSAFAGFFNSSIPWDLTVAYSVTYANNNRNPEITNNSLMASGNITLSPGWRVGFSSGYDFKNKGVTYTQLRFERDLKSWRMDFSWIPIGIYSQWNFFIGIKSSILQDIKYEKRKSPDKTYRN